MTPDIFGLMFDIPVSMSYNNKLSSNISETVNMFAAFYVYDNRAHGGFQSFYFDSLVNVSRYNTEILEAY